MSSPLATLEIVLGLLSLDIFIKAEACKSAYKLAVASHWHEGLLKTGHRTITMVTLDSSGLNMTSGVMGSE